MRRSPSAFGCSFFARGSLGKSSSPPSSRSVVEPKCPPELALHEPAHDLGRAARVLEASARDEEHEIERAAVLARGQNRSIDAENGIAVRGALRRQRMALGTNSPFAPNPIK